MKRSKQAARPPRAVPARVARLSAGDEIPRWLIPVAYGIVVIALFPEFFFRGALLLGIDTYALSYFARDFFTESVRTTQSFPVWDPLLFGGLPFVEGMHGDIFYPPSLALFFLDARAMWGWKMILHVFLAGIFMYLWLRGIGLRRGPAFFGGLAYMMGAELVSLVFPGGDGKLFVSALAPLVFWLAERAVTRRTLSDFAFFALGIALVVFTSHMQLAFFAVWGVSLYFFFRLAQVWRAERNPRHLTWLVAAYMAAGVIGAVGAAAVQFLPPLGYLREWSHRAERTVQAQGESGYRFSTSYSLHAEEIVSLVVPEFVGDAGGTETRPSNRYWGRNPLKFNSEYAGLVPLLLAPLLFLRRREPRVWFFSGLAVLSLLYALGADTPFFRLFYLIPGVNLFRAPSLVIFLYGLSIATLGAIAVQRMLDWSAGDASQHGAVRRILWILAGILTLLAILESAGAITSLWQQIFVVTKVTELQANMPYIRAGFWIACLIGVGVAGIWELLARGIAGRKFALYALLAIVALDNYRADRPFIRSTVLYGDAMLQQSPTLFEPDESIRFLQEAGATEPPFRAWDLNAYEVNVLAAHGIEQLAGHHGNEIGRYRQFVGGDTADSVRTSNLRLAHIANVTYLTVPGRLDPLPPFLKPVFEGRRSIVYRNESVLPRAYLVGRVQVTPDENAVATLMAENFDARGTAVLPDSLGAGMEIQPDPQGSVEWISRAADDYTLSVTTDRPALLVISENFYPAWHAYMDSAEIPILRANYTFRAVHVPAGTHQIRFRYESAVLNNSALASVIILGVLLAIGIAGLMRPAARASSSA